MIHIKYCEGAWELKYVQIIVQQREGLRHEVLTLALQRHGDRLARPVTVFQNFDKLSGAWLLALRLASLPRSSQKLWLPPLPPLACCRYWWVGGQEHCDGWGCD